jgi:hypothetical protein
MPHNDDADRRSPWYEAFAPALRLPWTPWVEAPKAEPQPARPSAEDAEDSSVTDALFDCYNG